MTWLNLNGFTDFSDPFEEESPISDIIQDTLVRKGIYCINLIGALGSGKTSCLIRIAEGLRDVKSYAIKGGDIGSDIDVQKLVRHGIEAALLPAGGACHIDGILVKKTLGKLSLSQKGVLFIENTGDLICPAKFNIGENIKFLIVTVADGADKPYKYPLAFDRAGVILVNKVDLKPYMDFDIAYFSKGVRALNVHNPIFEVSAKTGTGFEAVCEWIKARL